MADDVEATAELSSEVPALKVRQWLEVWNDITFDPSQNQARPSEHFYLCSISASRLRKLSGIYRRSTDQVQPRKDDLRIQRKHDPERSEEIRLFVEGGHPWSGLSEAKRKNPENDALKKPGWLPTAVVVNILQPGDERGGQALSADNAIVITDDEKGGIAQLRLPNEVLPDAIPPLEVIDGQHRLFAFDDDDPALADYALPVVAFHGLDISWQAYLFWTINIKPKKINPSLAFDLYPLLREQDWLDKGESVIVYRESRSQELTEMLWSSPESPWYRRINMLGGSRKENGPVTQAAFIRSLMASMVKPWRGRGGPGGIFGGTPDKNDGLTWSRIQQSAFLLVAWKTLAEAVTSSDAEWAESLRDESATLEATGPGGSDSDPAFSGPFSLLASDQGVRGFQSTLNDFCYTRSHELQLDQWQDDTDFSDVTPESVGHAAATLRDQPVFEFIQEVCDGLASFDWRSSNTPGLTETERVAKAALRGSGGYKELRTRLQKHLATVGSERVKATAASLEF
ncbi:DGQHR domain-containing protein [Nocardioides aequoreus]|uniref:DGQHR domain-containing protein n=1 Tax=Nocardioides aequoreus TaxID=397278 RepID=UPI00068FAFBB|nr:DGQHR domain-containing protein [Nocardioides aequoreus]